MSFETAAPYYADGADLLSTNGVFTAARPNITEPGRYRVWFNSRVNVAGGIGTTATDHTFIAQINAGEILYRTSGFPTPEDVSVGKLDIEDTFEFTIPEATTAGLQFSRTMIGGASGHNTVFRVERIG